MLWEAQHKLAKPRPESKTLIHYSYLKVCTQKLLVLVHNFWQFLFRSLTLIWTPRISTCLNSSSSWSNYSAIVTSNFIIPWNQTGLQENDTSIAEDLNLRKKEYCSVFLQATQQCCNHASISVEQREHLCFLDNFKWRFYYKAFCSHSCTQDMWKIT